MKRINITVVMTLMLMASVAFTSCENKQVKKLRNSIEKINKTCPVDANLTTLNGIDYDETNNQVQFNYVVNENYTSADAFKATVAEWKNIVMMGFQTPEGRAFITDLTRSGASVKLSLKTPSLDKAFDTDLSADNLKMAQDNQIAKPKDKALLVLQQKAAIDSKLCPISLPDGKTITKVEFTDKAIAYTFAIDSKNVADVRRNKPNLENNFKYDLRESLKSDIATQGLAKAMVDAGAKMKCIYVDNNNAEIISFSVTAYEFNELLPAALQKK